MKIVEIAMEQRHFVALMAVLRDIYSLKKLGNAFLAQLDVEDAKLPMFQNASDATEDTIHH